MMNRSSVTSRFVEAAQNKWAVLGFCLLSGLLLFGNTFGNDFVMDDVSFIRDAQILKDIRNVPQLFGPYYYRLPTAVYRPITATSYALTYFFLGSGVWGFHLGNILLHALNSWLLYLLVRKLTLRKGLAFLTAFLFLILPVHVEAVTGLTGRTELLTFFFSFLTLLLLCSPDGLWWRLPLGGICFSLALLSKETALAVPPVCFFVLLHRKKSFRAVKKYFLHALVLVLVLIAYCTVRYLILGERTLFGNATIVENPLKFVPLPVRLLTALEILALYLGKIIFPVRLSSDYFYNQIPAVTHLANAGTWIGVVVLAATVVILCRPKKTVGFFYLGTVFFLWSYLPISNLPVPIGIIFGERLMYFPSAGICLVMAGLFLWSLEKSRRPWKAVTFLLLLSLIIFYVARTWIRNYDWRSENTLFASAARVSPNSVVARSNLGAMYILEGKLDAAQKELIAAINIYPYYAHALNNLGLVYYNRGQFEKAEEQFFKALDATPGYPNAYENLGLLYLDRGKPLEAKRWLVPFFGGDEKKADLYIYQYRNCSGSQKSESRSQNEGKSGEI